METCAADTPEDFTDMLAQLYNNRQKVAFLIDDNGWERVSGYIQILNEQTVELEDGSVILKDKIAAVNGVFKKGSTC